MSNPSAKRALDLAAGGALFLAAFLYLGAFPRNLGIADESYFLLEAARLRGGEVMYRDVFDFITPLASYAMALLFSIFGTTIDTARLTTAALHGTTSALIFGSCRRMDVRLPLAAAAAVAYLAIGPPAWPVASWHWFSTAVSTAALFTLLAPLTPTPRRAAFLVGLIIGLQIGIQQQKGVVLALTVALLLAVQPWFERDRSKAAGILPRLLAFAAGVAAITAPLFLYCLARTGWTPLFDALVRFPLFTYAPHNHTSWGGATLLAARFAQQTFPTLLRYAPVLLIPLLLRAAWLGLRGSDREQLWHLVVLTIFTAASIASISYYPDVIHIAFISPVFLVCAAEAAEWSLAPLARRRRVANAVAWLSATALIALAVPHLAKTLARARALYPYEHPTAFGTVAFHSRWEPLFVDHVRSLLRRAGTRELFCYPNATSPYLTIGARNPTPYQFFLASFSPPEQTREVLSILRDRRLPYIIGSPLLMRPDDPVVELINREYEIAPIPAIEKSGERASLWLYRRKDLAEAPDSGDRDAS